MSSPRASAVQDRILLRYRGEGHVRFDLPRELCEEPAAAALERALGAVEGVRRVVVYRRSRKLSIRYLEGVCGFLDLARRLSACAPEALLAGRPEGLEPRPGLKGRLLGLTPVRRARAKYRELKETAQALVTLARARLGRDPASPLVAERDVVLFLNDLVAFYLIKLHWRQITTEWLRRPFAYRYQWLTTFYLVFLMVRHRKAGK